MAITQQFQRMDNLGKFICLCTINFDHRLVLLNSLLQGTGSQRVGPAGPQNPFAPSSFPGKLFSWYGQAIQAATLCMNLFENLGYLFPHIWENVCKFPSPFLASQDTLEVVSEDTHWRLWHGACATWWMKMEDVGWNEHKCMKKIYGNGRNRWQWIGWRQMIWIKMDEWILKRCYGWKWTTFDENE